MIHSVRWPQMIASRPRRLWSGCGFLLMGFWAAMAGANPADDGPASMRDVEFWRGRAVVQVFGHVFTLEDKANVATEFYWVLDESAVGKVTECIDGNVVRVEFSDSTGWGKTAVPPPETEIKTTFTYGYDDYGKRVQSVDSVIVKKEGLRIPPRKWGRVIEDDGVRRVVEFPMELLGLKRPRRGDRVVRGPDWRAGHADGGSRPVGSLSPSDENCWGEVMEEYDADGYVKVRWNKTGREGFYRFDWRRYYDIEVPPPAGE